MKNIPAKSEMMNINSENNYLPILECAARCRVDTTFILKGVYL
jgi:hypothetical protein